MIPDKRMLRYHNEIGFYELSFPADDIKFFKEKFHRNEREKNLNINHNEIVSEGIKISNSYLISEVNRQSLPVTYQDLPNGTWMIECSIDKSEMLEHIEDIGLRGFSIEITFTIKGEDGKKYTVHENFRRINKLSDLLAFEIWVHGGSTYGSGRNEHGEAHFELKEKNTRKPLGKIFMPTMETWLNSMDRTTLLKVQNGKDISTKEKKGMVQWLELNDNENLIMCHKEWNECNKDNNRTTQI